MRRPPRRPPLSPPPPLSRSPAPRLPPLTALPPPHLWLARPIGTQAGDRKSKPLNSSHRPISFFPSVFFLNAPPPPKTPPLPPPAPLPLPGPPPPPVDCPPPAAPVAGASHRHRSG